VSDKADSERRGGIHRLLDHLVHAQGVGPEGLVAEGLEAEDVLPFGDERGREAGASGVVGAGGEREDRGASCERAREQASS